MPRTPSRTCRPRVLVNMAMTADGKIATADRGFASFGSRTDHDHLLDLRATADAVLCGAATAAGAGITLGPGAARWQRRRRRRGLARFNLRVIASGSASMNPDAEVFRHRFSPIVVLTTERAPATRVGRLRTVADVVATFGQRTLNLGAALEWLHLEWGVKRLVCEGGGELNFAMLHAGLVDEVHLTICPMITGGRRAPTIADGAGFARLAGARPLRLRSRRRVGDELFLVYDAVDGPVSRVSTQRAKSHSRSATRLK